MKFQPFLLVLSLTVTGIAAVQQNDLPAEKAYKNIKSMTGTPSSEVIPAMKFMSASLKVDCEFCHKADDYASDEKSEKNATRHMIEMQKDINTKNFRGRLQVTCVTCHNGSPSPQRAPMVAGISRRTINREGTALLPADIIKMYQTAVGSEPKTMSFEGKITGFGPKPQTIKISQGAPNKFLFDTPERKMGFNGIITWISESGTSFQLPLDQAFQVQSFGNFFRGEHAFDTFGVLRFAGRDKIDNKNVVVLRSGAQNAKITNDFYFDVKTGLLSRLVSYTTTILGSIPEVADFGNYRKVGGTMVPFKITRSGGKDPIVITLEKATANPKLGDNFFDSPISKIGDGVN